MMMMMVVVVVVVVVFGTIWDGYIYMDHGEGNRGIRDPFLWWL
jgi:hypothetical protein